MSYYDEIYELAVDNHYLISTSQAREAGIPAVELAKLAHRGRLENICRGLYRLTRYVPSESDPYAIAVARFGDDAYLWGESVIALLGLAPTDPSRLYVAVPGRVRRKLPQNLHVVKANPSEDITLYEGVPSQTVANALRSASGTMMDGRVRDAADTARREGYLTRDVYEELVEEMGWR